MEDEILHFWCNRDIQAAAPAIALEDSAGLCVCSVAQSGPTLCNPIGYTQASGLMGFSRQEYQSGLPFPSPGDLPGPASPALASEFFTTGPPGKATNTVSCPKLNPTFESAGKAPWE